MVLRPNLVESFCAFWIVFCLFALPALAAGEGAEQQEKSPPPSVVEPPKTYEVRIPRDTLKFDPPILKIRPGDTVQWINESEKVHVLASIPGAGANDKELLSPSPGFRPGETWNHTFEKAGDYPYFCFIHSQMMGAIVVEAAPESSGDQSPK